MLFSDKIDAALFYPALATVIVAVLAAVGAMLVQRFKPEWLKKYLLIAASAFIVTLAVSVGLIAASGKKLTIIPELFYPILASVLTAVAVSVAVVLIGKFKIEFLRAALFIGLGLLLVPVIVSIVYISKYYAEQTSMWEMAENSTALIISAVLVAAVSVGVALIFGKKTEQNKQTKSIVYAAICIALSFGLSYIKLFPMPAGGSVTFVSLLPLAVYSYMFGVRKGVLAGFIYGILQAVQDPWIIHPAQFLLDYLIAFSFIGFAGLFKDIGLFKEKQLLNFVLGCFSAAFFRYLSSALAGTFAFHSWMPSQFSYTAVQWGFLYNLFVFVDIALVIIAGILLWQSKNFRKLLENEAI